MQCCRIADLRCKEVVCLKTGICLGCVNDVEVDTCTGKVVALVVYGPPKCFGLLGREDDYIVRWEDIEVIGQDTILVCFTPKCCSGKKGRGRGFMKKIFG